MNLFDLGGMLLVFAIIAYVGWRSTAKVDSLDDFTLAGSNLNKMQAGFSMAATEFGGSSLIGAIALCYTIGISGAWWDWAAVPAFLLLGVFFAGKIKLPHLVTITDFFELRYDRKTKILASSMHILAIATQLSTQFMVASVALNGIFGIPKPIGLAIGVLLVLFYTAGGGLIAVVNTDIVQFIMIVLSWVVLLPIGLVRVGGISGITENLSTSFFDPIAIGIPTILSWCVFCFFTYATNQHYLQRIFAAKDNSTAKFSFYFTGIAYLVYGIVVGVLSLCIAVLLPGLEDPNMGYALFIREFAPVGLAGLSLGAIFAATMSTADSMLLAASTLFVNDIYRPCINPRASDRDSLRIIRIVTIVICLLSVGVSLVMDNIIQIMYLGGLFYSTAVFFPLILGLWWKRGTQTAAFYSILLSAAVGLVSEFFLAGQVPGIWGMPSNVLAALTSIISFLLLSLCTAPPSPDTLARLNHK